MIRRSKKLIPGSFQLPFVGSFVCVAVLALVLQFLLLGVTVFRTAVALDGPGGELAMQIPGMLLEVFAISLVVLLPVLFLVCISITHRVAGPLYRMAKYLTEVLDGTETKPCRIRKADWLHELNDLMNRATAELREENALRLGVSKDDAEPGELRKAG